MDSCIKDLRRVFSLRSRVLIASALMVTLLFFSVLPGFSHLASFTNTQPPQRERWDASAFSVAWNLNPSTGGAEIHGNRTVAEVISASFRTWMDSPNASLNFPRGSDSSSKSFGADGTNLICFVCESDFTQDLETLAVTFVSVGSPGDSDLHGGRVGFVGQIVDADILFNPKVSFGTDGGGDQDLETVATHEIGHFLGLDHSAVVRAVMFPFAPNSLKTLSYDDVAGISVLYPKTAPDVPTGVIAGTVRTTTGAPVFGAHVYATSLTAVDVFAGRNIRKTPVGTLTLPDGSYRIEGVPPDSYNVIVEPLDEPMTSENVPDYGNAFGRTIQTNFTTRWR